MSIREEAYQCGVNKNWNRFRELYDSLTIEDLVYINTEWDKILPPQICSSLRPIATALAKAKNVQNIVELGCHRGRLAEHIILNTPIRINKWVGYDINHEAVKVGNKRDIPKYKSVKLNQWFWEIDISDYDTFVSSHTLEHFSLDQAKKVFRHIASCRNIIIEIPIRKHWRGYRGSHVLVTSREEIEKSFFEHSKRFEFTTAKGWIIGLTSEGG